MNTPYLEFKQLVNEYLQMLYGKKQFYKKTEYFKVIQVIDLCLSKRFEILICLESKTHNELYDNLAKQKLALKENFNKLQCASIKNVKTKYI